jgi:choloylglycine hydrolase
MCSGIRIICKDGSVLLCRTMEFGIELQYNISKKKNIIGVTTDNYYVDGLNEHGLSVMTFYFPGFDQYIDINSISENANIVPLASITVANYLLENATSIKDIKNLTSKIRVTTEKYMKFNMVMPFHWFCADKSGECIMIECVNGVPIVYDNKLGISTNSPTYPEHLISLQAFPDFSQYNSDKKKISEGTGMLGLPGDFTSISRFIRLNLFQQYHDEPKNVLDGISTSFHILNNFDIVKGFVIDKKTKVEEYTQYTIVYDLGHFNAWFKPYGEPTIRNLRNPKKVFFTSYIKKNKDGYKLVKCKNAKTLKQCRENSRTIKKSKKNPYRL